MARRRGFKKTTPAFTPLSSFDPGAIVVGVDEVGVGPLAGPMFACAIAFRAGHEPIPGVTDSKKVAEKKRERLKEQILDQCVGAGVGFVDPGELDDIGMSMARKQVLIRAVEDLDIEYHHLYIDGDLYLRELPDAERVVKGDEKIWIVGAASIVAKQEQCAVMAKYHEWWPEYGFCRHHGYGTREHMNALKKHGARPGHRMSMKPLRDLEE